MNGDTLYSGSNFAADAASADRATFIRRTYAHLAGALLAFAAVESALFLTSFPSAMVGLLGTSRFSWLLVLGAFMGVSYLADNWAQSSTSKSTQYAGLGIYVVAEAIIFVPLLYMATAIAGSDVIWSAAVLTLLLFTGLTFTALTTRRDFSFLGGVLKMSCFVALGVIIASALFGFTLGVLFSSAMILVASASILYNTSNIVHRYNSNQYVAAALSLFASVALLFWYVLRILMGISRRS
jgi:FtsH-binding integral membrane protein